MNAKEMFEKLGYRLTDDSDLDYMTYKKGDIEINFIIFEKVYHCSKQLILTWVPIKVDVDLYKAITQQMKELGWIE